MESFTAPPKSLVNFTAILRFRFYKIAHQREGATWNVFKVETSRKNAVYFRCDDLMNSEYL